MIAVIGEMTVSFRKNGDVWTRRFSGLGYNWAKKLKEEKNDVLLLTVLPFGDLGKEMADDLVSVRYRGGRQVNGVKTADFIAEVHKTIDSKEQL